MTIKIRKNEQECYVSQLWHIENIELMFHPYPTNNCQIASLCRVNPLFDNNNNNNMLLPIFTKAKSKVNCLLIDTYYRYLDENENLKKIKKSFIMCSPYTNTTGNEMVMLLIDLKKAIDILTEE